MRKLAMLMAVSIAATGFSTAAQAQLSPLGYFANNGSECEGSSFASCYASSNGVNIAGDNESSAVYKLNFDNTEDFGNFASINGDEFVITYPDPAGSNTLTFTYTPGQDDPDIHYVAIFQGGDPVGGPKGAGPGYELWYSASAVTSGSLDLSQFFQNTGWSHITFFDTTRDPRTPPVPEPATWAMMLFGFGATGLALRRNRRRGVRLSQIA